MVMKHLRYGLLAALFAVSSLSHAVALDTAPLKGKSLAFVVQDLSNPIWAQYAKTLKEVGESHGMRVTAMDCKSNAATQITQVENVIQEGTDAIILHPAEANALEEVAGRAKEAGMKVISWDILMKNADVGYLKDNFVAGKLVGEQAAKWINEKLGGVAQVALLEYPVYPELIQRASGIEAGLKEFAPKAEIVARAPAINATEGMSKTETLLMANPDIKIICCIGDGGAVGANEAVKAAGLDADDFGIFGCDGSQEALSKVKNNEPLRMSISWGTSYDTVDELLTLTSGLLGNKDVDQEFICGMTPVTIDNVNDYIE